jgi:hypothetical protein
MEKILAHVSHNVPEQRRGNERSDLVKRNPEPPTGGEAYTDLLCEVAPPSIFQYSMNIIFYLISFRL